MQMVSLGVAATTLGWTRELHGRSCVPTHARRRTHMHTHTHTSGIPEYWGSMKHRREGCQSNLGAWHLGCLRKRHLHIANSTLLAAESQGHGPRCNHPFSARQGAKEGIPEKLTPEAPVSLPHQEEKRFCLFCCPAVFLLAENSQKGSGQFTLHSFPWNIMFWELERNVTSLWIC